MQVETAAPSPKREGPEEKPAQLKEGDAKQIETADPLVLALAIGDRDRRLDSLHHLGRTYLNLQNYQKAHKVYHAIRMEFPVSAPEHKDPLPLTPPPNKAVVPAPPVSEAVLSNADHDPVAIQQAVQQIEASTSASTTQSDDNRTSWLSSELTTRLGAIKHSL
ncbi:MAG: hypothetical protein AAGD25_32055 [Cyanobacteria bacterium P01_F01_bin.150]